MLAEGRVIHVETVFMTFNLQTMPDANVSEFGVYCDIMHLTLEKVSCSTSVAKQAKTAFRPGLTMWNVNVLIAGDRTRNLR